MYLEKEKTLFGRDEEGNILPVEVELELLEDKPKIKVTPMTKGELNKLWTEVAGGNTTVEQDEEIILKHCVQPKYTEDEVKVMKPQFSSAIVTAILAISLGVTQKSISDATVAKAIEMQDVLLKKK